MCTWNLHNIAEPLYGVNQKNKKLCTVLGPSCLGTNHNIWTLANLCPFGFCFICFFGWLGGWLLFQHLRQVEVPRPGTELEPQPQSIPQLWQHQILNPLHHRENAFWGLLRNPNSQHLYYACRIWKNKMRNWAWNKPDECQTSPLLKMEVWVGVLFYSVPFHPILFILC